MSDWWQCLLVGDVPEPWYDYWDQVLFEVSCNANAICMQFSELSHDLMWMEVSNVEVVI